jgi:putative membrane protein
MNRIPTLALSLALALSAGQFGAHAQSNSAADAASTLSPVDYNFVAQANLGAPFQIDSGRLAELKATTPNIRDYAHLMVVTHIPVVDDLNAILQRKRIAAAPETLLQGAYDAMIASLRVDTGAELDRDYVEGQVDYQKGNAALFRHEIQYGADPELRAFAQRTLPKIEDHLERAEKLAKDETLGVSTQQRLASPARIGTTE